MKWFCTLIKFKGISDSISSNKESSDNPWCDNGSRDTKNLIPGYSFSNTYKKQGLDDYVFHTLECFYQTNKCNEIGWLLLIVLGKVGKEKDDLRDLNFYPKHHINGLQVFIFSLKEMHLFCK